MRCNAAQKARRTLLSFTVTTPWEVFLVFDNLIESKPRKQRRLGQTIMSVALHVALGALVIKATAGAAEAALDRPVDTTMVFLKPPPPPPPPPPEQPPPDVVIAANPPPQGFQTVVPPDVIPTEIPPVDLDAKKFDPRDFTGKGVEGGIAAGVPGITNAPETISGEVFLAAQLDDPVQPISQPKPRYPPALQAAGVTGHAVVEFIVNTEGKVEPGSVKIISSTHQAFEEPAREAILKSTFRPARYRGQPVRQLVNQRVSFQLGA